nr:immunoglobulin light chain junction region [Macaca mulatta]
CQQESNWLTF